MFKGIHHIGYWVSDLDATVKAYEELYGGKVEFTTFIEESKTKVAFVVSGNTMVELMEPGDKSVLKGEKAQVLHHVGYLVDDIQQAAEELRSRGARFLTEAPGKNAIGWQIWYYDGGEMLGVRQHIAQY